MWFKWLGSAALIFTADRISKSIVATMLDLGERVSVWPVFSWVHLNNRGAAFSFLADGSGWQRWFFVALGIGFFAFILGGALGNLYDRIVHGFVVDFVLVHWGEYYFPAFNVADSAITVGAGL